MRMLELPGCLTDFVKDTEEGSIWFRQTLSNPNAGGGDSHALQYQRGLTVHPENDLVFESQCKYAWIDARTQCCEKEEYLVAYSLCDDLQIAAFLINRIKCTVNPFHYTSQNRDDTALISRTGSRKPHREAEKAGTGDASKDFGTREERNIMGSGDEGAVRIGTLTARKY